MLPPAIYAIIIITFLVAAVICGVGLYYLTQIVYKNESYNNYNRAKQWLIKASIVLLWLNFAVGFLHLGRRGK